MSAGTARRSVRIDDELWLAAVDATTAQGTTISDVVRETLERYVASYAERWIEPDEPE